MPETDHEAGQATQRFQAFAARRDDDELPAPWRMRASGRKIAILLAGVLLAAILAVIFGNLLVS